MNPTLSPEQADDLIIRFLSGQTSIEEQQLLEQWMAADEDHLQQFIALRDTWLLSYQPDAGAPYNTGAAWSAMGLEQAEVHRPFWKRMRPGWGSIAALLLLSMVIGGGVVFAFLQGRMGGGNDGVVTVVSPKGATTYVQLSDGSEVWLNAGSRLLYARGYDADKREVKLEGEAFFKVRTNPAKPFVVKAADLRIKALGTSFNVKAYAEEQTVVTTLVEGKVKIEAPDVSKAVDIVLQPRQHVTYHRAAAVAEDRTVPVAAHKKVMPAASTIESSQLEDTAPYTAWVAGNWIISSATLEELAVTMERKYNVRVVFASEELKHYKFSGTFRQETLEQVLDVLKLTAPLSYQINHGLVMLKMDSELKEQYSRALPGSHSK
ncbi:DUF4974 domain-containing protein [Chitinophaga pendula]|uniref:FecR family protein n=1 Tax=Chitinophaga TaxID=79328 RepID=UPI000BAFA7C0|nr:MULTISPECIES: FecR domain-containing protein [Chitinophaga]ASZ10481.1 hypothetical protein CK934_05565 [Chitinophaga sp. MD30]UCJ06548.1 DUF4974 domain-containing protein [Chitinophaga pendula]